MSVRVISWIVLRLGQTNDPRNDTSHNEMKSEQDSATLEDMNRPTQLKLCDFNRVMSMPSRPNRVNLRGEVLEIRRSTKQHEMTRNVLVIFRVTSWIVLPFSPQTRIAYFKNARSNTTHRFTPLTRIEGTL